MFHAIARKGVVAFIAEMTVDYRSPALVGDLLVCEAEVVKHDGKKIDVLATMVNGNTNVTVAEDGDCSLRSILRDCSSKMISGGSSFVPL